MKTVLCYGDSNTYGFNPSNGMRYARDVRWTGILQNILGPDYHVIEEGCNGRTTIYDDPTEAWKNGRTYLKPCLNTHKPIDIVILMLGSNDLKDYFHAAASQIAHGAGVLLDEIIAFTEEKQGFCPEIILVSPIEIGPDMETSAFRDHFDQTAVERSKDFKEEYFRVAQERGVFFFDAASVAKASKIDSLHMDPEEHRKLGEALAREVKNLP